MPNLFVIGFDEPHQAEELCLKIQELQSKYVIDLQDMVVAVKDEKGKIKLDYRENLLTANRPVFPGFCGSLTALIFLNATTAAAGSALAAVGITQGFMKELAGLLIPGGSALFALTGLPSPDRERVDRIRWQNLDDFAFALGRGQTASSLTSGQAVNRMPSFGLLRHRTLVR